MISSRRSTSSGFSLLEVLVALAIMAIAIMALTALRTNSIITAAEARNLRVARSIADKVLSEVQAGMVKVYDMRDQELTEEAFPDFSYKIVVGDVAIQEEETLNSENQAGASTATDEDVRQYDRQTWLNRRADLQRARAQGVTFDQYRPEELEEDDEPDEETFEEVAVYVYWPSLQREGDRESYHLRTRVSTLALSGLTAEDAQSRSTTIGNSPTQPSEGSR